jgi:hypothetical protein
MFRIRNIMRLWLPLALVITLLSGLIYTAAQQVLRLSANDPQIQMAQDAAAALTAGASVESLVPATPVDIATSLAPYLVVYDETSRAVAGSARLHGALPALPSGVFEYVRRAGLDKISWQPEPGVRSAAVVAPAGGAHPGFVMAGRSLREVENRIDSLGNLMLVGWWGTMAAALVAVIAAEFIFRRSDGASGASRPR